MTKVYIEYRSIDYITMFLGAGFEVVTDVDEADLVCFTGGSDVSPHLYGHQRHNTTFNDTYRDAKEQRLFDTCVDRGIPMVGICRGGQFLNVMCGGTMFQDVTHHTRNHYITDLGTGQILLVSSTHHQMMCPAENAQIVAVASEGGFRTFWSPVREKFISEPSVHDYEVLYYEDKKALCFQPHPEFNSPMYKDMRKYFIDMVNKVVNTGKVE